MHLNENQLNRDFENLTIGYVEQLFRLAYARVGNIQDAEDIVQETYLKAYKSFSTFRSGTRIQNWLAQILINLTRDHYRKVSRSPATVELDEDFGDGADAPAFMSPEEQLCRDEIDPQLSTALMSMSEVLVRPLLLREIYDATYEEIAEILVVPKGTVMSRLARARAALRNRLLSNPDASADDLRGLRK